MVYSPCSIYIRMVLEDNELHLRVDATKSDLKGAGGEAASLQGLMRLFNNPGKQGGPKT